MEQNRKYTITFKFVTQEELEGLGIVELTNGLEGGAVVWRRSVYRC